jgi:hypothetical protein
MACASASHGNLLIFLKDCRKPTSQDLLVEVSTGPCRSVHSALNMKPNLPLQAPTNP